MKRIAHRGLSGLYPENTIEAFAAALPYRPDAIELDVQLTRDGQVVIFHDETLDRLGRRPGWLKDFTYEELRGLPVAIPLLEDYFRLIDGVSVDTFVEMKNSFIVYPELEEKTIAVAERFGRLDDCILDVCIWKQIASPSGAGKSSLIRCINRLIMPSAGEILLEGRDLVKLSNNELRQARRH